jgi:transposase
MSAEGMGQAMSVEGATDGAAFEAYLKHFLLPTLKEGQMVVMDNLQVHKSSRVRASSLRVWEPERLVLSALYSPRFLSD